MANEVYGDPSEVSVRNELKCHSYCSTTLAQLIVMLLGLHYDAQSNFSFGAPYPFPRYNHDRTSEDPLMRRPVYSQLYFCIIVACYSRGRELLCMRGLYGGLATL